MSKGDKVSVELVGGPPWGFRLGGGSDFGCPLEIAKLRKKSKATQAGLAEGDVVTVIDHQNVASKSHGDAMKVIELAGPTLRLEIIKGVGPSAGLMNTSIMSDSMTTSQSDVMDFTSSQSHVALTNSQSPPRRSSTPRILTVIPSAPLHKGASKVAEMKPPTQTDPWTVNVTSFEFANTVDSTAKPQTLRVHPKQPPPTSPKPKFKANTLPRKSTAEKSSRPGFPSWEAPPINPTLQHVFNTEQPQHDSNVSTLPKAPPMFKVAKIDAKLKTWQPTSMKNVAFDDPKHTFNSPAIKDTTQTSPFLAQSYEPHTQTMNHSPAVQSYDIPQAPPPPSMSPRKPANHIPGMVNPLICDDSQGDFGANPLVRPNTAGEGTKAKKIYSDSAFYDSPKMSYPTIQEQVALAREISSFLESNQNTRSRGGRMFSKRKQRAEEWSMNSQGQRKNIQQLAKFDSLSAGMPAFSMQRTEFGYNHVRHHPDPIKSKIDAAELEQIQHNQDSLCKHDELPPNIAFDINHALSTSLGKAGQFFERRKLRAEKYVVDENNHRNWQPQSMSLQPQVIPCNNPLPVTTRSYKSPWEAAAEGHLDAAFPDVPRSGNYQQAPQPSPGSRQYPFSPGSQQYPPSPGSQQYQPSPGSQQYQPSPGSQQYQPLNVITNQQNTSNPQLNVKYKTFKPVAPAYTSSPAASSRLTLTAKPKTRLEMMLEASASDPPLQINSSLDISHGHYSRDADTVQLISPAASNVSYTQSSVYSPVAPSFARTSSLRRPKDYLPDTKATRGYQNNSVSAF